jgi:transposase
VGRESGQLRLAVSQSTTRKELEVLVLQHTMPLTCSNTDEWKGYSHLSNLQRVHKTVNHGDKQWAKDEDKDGINEVHTNTIEGMWTGLRNFLRTFRGVCKWYLYQYCAMHEWRHNTKTFTPAFCQAMCFHYNDLPL